MRLQSIDGKTELLQQPEYKLRNMWEAWYTFLDRVANHVSQMLVDSGFTCITPYIVTNVKQDSVDHLLLHR
jgi:hypothetical protein